MAKRQTKYCRYKSKYGIDVWVTFAQHIAEKMCERLAIKQSTKLPLEFWNIKPWKEHFRYQMVLANKLKQFYPQEAIINGLNRAETKSVYSLNATFTLSKIFREEANKLLQKSQNCEIISELEPIIKTDESPRAPFHIGKSLRGLDE